MGTVSCQNFHSYPAWRCKSRKLVYPAEFSLFRSIRGCHFLPPGVSGEGGGLPLTTFWGSNIRIIIRIIIIIIILLPLLLLLIIILVIIVIIIIVILLIIIVIIIIILLLLLIFFPSSSSSSSSCTLSLDEVLSHQLSFTLLSLNFCWVALRR